MVKSFCKDCPNRHTICHDTCPQYQKYKQELKAENAYNQGKRKPAKANGGADSETENKV